MKSLHIYGGCNILIIHLLYANVFTSVLYIHISRSLILHLVQ